MTDFNDLVKEINKFREERDWQKFHNAKDLSISISLEAAELLENFQWKNSENALEKNRSNIEDELADVFMYSIMLSEELGLDVIEIIGKKLNKNAVKYPVDKSKGNNKKYNEF